MKKAKNTYRIFIGMRDFVSPSEYDNCIYMVATGEVKTWEDAGYENVHSLDKAIKIAERYYARDKKIIEYPSGKEVWKTS